MQQSGTTFVTPTLPLAQAVVATTTKDLVASAAPAMAFSIGRHSVQLISKRKWTSMASD